MLGEKIARVSLTNHNVPSAVLQMGVSTQKLKIKLRWVSKNILLEIPSQI